MPLFAPFSPMLPSPVWFPFSPATHITSVERMHRSSCRVITGCLSSTPIPLLHLEALLPPLRVTITQQSLSFFKRAVRLSSTFPLASLANSYPVSRKDNGDPFPDLITLPLTYNYLANP